MIIYLYVKTHNVTGLKYLGKTTKLDPHKYPGSGTVWKNHLKKHGKDYQTNILKECSTEEELKYWGRYYSILWNVVESSDWANLKYEEGEGGPIHPAVRTKISLAKKGILKTSEHKDKISQSKKGQKYGPQTNTHKENNAASKRGRPQPKDAIARRTAKRIGKKWFHNELRSVLASECPHGFTPGRRPGDTKGKPSNLKWFTNGHQNIMAVSCPDGFRPGVTKNYKSKN